MKGTIIAAMVAAAAAASAATIYALKKAHDKRLEAACNCDDRRAAAQMTTSAPAVTNRKTKKIPKTLPKQQAAAVQMVFALSIPRTTKQTSRQPCTCRKKNLPTMQSRNRTIPQIMLKRRFRFLPATRTDGITFCAGLWLSLS
mgnify:CR=1 FL=1